MATNDNKGLMATIFCASSPKIRDVYFDDARKLTTLLGQAGYGIVYGGGSVGLMGCIADQALAQGMKITGVIPTFMVEVEWQHNGVADMRQTKTMAERKQLLIELGDAIIILPGSTGTMDELFDAMADKKLGLLHKPIVVLNTDHFYDALKVQLQKMVDENFMNETHLKTIFFAETPEDVMSHLSAHEEVTISLLDAAVK